LSFWSSFTHPFFFLGGSPEQAAADNARSPPRRPSSEPAAPPSRSPPHRRPRSLPRRRRCPRSPPRRCPRIPPRRRPLVPAPSPPPSPPYRRLRSPPLGRCSCRPERATEPPYWPRELEDGRGGGRREQPHDSRVLLRRSSSRISFPKLDENKLLIRAILYNQNNGKYKECKSCVLLTKIDLQKFATDQAS
ncbi:unnamed protein product, partial [Urochloa humidicola]